MLTIEKGDFSYAPSARKVTPIPLEVPMPTVQIMSVVGSAVPAPLRELGLLACWYVVRDGETISGPLTSLSDAEKQLQHASNFRLHA